MTLHLTARDVATLVAALHAWQNELSYHTIEELRGWHPQLRDYEPLTIEEVGGLLWRLAAAASHIEDAESTVSSVSTVSTQGTGGAS